MDGFFAIIEHPTRGTLRELEADWVKGEVVYTPRFSREGMRNDPDRTKMYHSLSAAFKDHKQIPPNIRDRCFVMVYNPMEISYYRLVKT